MGAAKKVPDKAIADLASRGLGSSAIARAVGISEGAIRKRLARLRVDHGAAAVSVVPIRRVGLPDLTAELNGSRGRLLGLIAGLEKDARRDDADAAARLADPPRLRPGERVSLQNAVERSLLLWVEQARRVMELVERGREVEEFIRCVWEALSPFPDIRADFERLLQERRLAHLSIAAQG